MARRNSDYDTLNCVVAALVGEIVLVELQNDSSVRGRLKHVDQGMK